VYLFKPGEKIGVKMV